jgi:hypothetical protein
VVSLLIAGFVWGFIRIRKRQSDVNQQILSVQERDIPTLTDECISVFSEKFGVHLDLDNLESSAQLLDESLLQSKQMNTMSAFECPGHAGWYVKPMGAFLGELIRKHAHGRWIQAEGGGLAMIIGDEPNTITLHPFDKIDKQRWSGDPGDLFAYVMTLQKGLAAIQATLPSSAEE